MKHCVLISAYKDTKLINRLISRIPQEWGVFIHIDKRSKIRNEDINPRAICAARRNVQWGSFAHVEAFLDMMRLAINDNRQFDFFHLITGQDYPVIDLRKADELVSAGKVYMRHEPIPRSCWNSWNGGFHFYKYKTFARWTDVRKPFYNRILNRLCKVVQFYRTKKMYMPQYNVEGGSSYMSLPREAIYILLSSQTSLDLQKRLKYSLDGEETFYQTVLMNSPLAKSVINDNLRIIVWPGPAVLTENDYNKIRSCHALFARKVDGEISAKLMDMLDNESNAEDRGAF